MLKFEKCNKYKPDLTRTLKSSTFGSAAYFSATRSSFPNQTLVKYQKVQKDIPTINNLIYVRQ